MGKIKRVGLYGEYYGNTFDSSNALTNEEMNVNALYIYSFLHDMGWTDNAIAGVLGNMQAESGLNPGRWQSNIIGGDPSSHGYSLVQWTPYTKYTEWCYSEGYTDPSEMDVAISRILYEVKNNIQWIGTGAYYGMSFEDFTKSNKSVRELAVGFLLCYERPADQSSSVQYYRGTLAENWYKYILGHEPSDPITPSGKKKKKKYNFILFNKRRRVN